MAESTDLEKAGLAQAPSPAENPPSDKKADEEEAARLKRKDALLLFMYLAVQRYHNVFGTVVSKPVASSIIHALFHDPSIPTEMFDRDAKLLAAFRRDFPEEWHRAKPWLAKPKVGRRYVRALLGFPREAQKWLVNHASLVDVSAGEKVESDAESPEHDRDKA